MRVRHLPVDVLDAMPTKLVIYSGRSQVLACDGNCAKAWGISDRPRTKLSRDPDDYVFIGDNDLGYAPEHTGTTEGFSSKSTLR